MSSHLTGQQISELLINGGSIEQQAHLENCAGCAREVAALRQVLGQFRGSVRNWSAEHMRMEPNAGRSTGWGTFAVRAVCAIFVIAMAIGGVRLAQSPASIAPGVPASDTALLDEVRLEVSRPVPSGMTPLLVPIGAQSSGSAGSR